MVNHPREESFFCFSPRVKGLFALAILITTSFFVLHITGLQSGVPFPNSGNNIESRTFHVNHGDFCRLSIGSSNNDWLILKVTSNVSSYVYVRGTTDGDLKQYGTNHLVVECENWFIVTVRPYQDSQIEIEWTHYDRDAEESDQELIVMSPQSILLSLTIVFDLLAIVALYRSRLTIVHC